MWRCVACEGRVRDLYSWFFMSFSGWMDACAMSSRFCALVLYVHTLTLTCVRMVLPADFVSACLVGCMHVLAADLDSEGPKTSGRVRSAIFPRP